jgi:hypothetical protein
MPDSREFAVTEILAISHGLPITLDPYIAILTYLNGRPASVLDSREIPGAWIRELHPVLNTINAPNIRSNGGNYTSAQLDAWDAWAEDAQARIGVATLALQPIPPDCRDQRTLMDQVLDTGVDPAIVWNTDPSRPNPSKGNPENHA